MNLKFNTSTWKSKLCLEFCLTNFKIVLSLNLLIYLIIYDYWTHFSWNPHLTLISLFLTWTIWGSMHYKKTWLFIMIIWPKCPQWPKGMSILTEGLGHENVTFDQYIWLKWHFFSKCQVENLVKMDKCPSKWPWLSQIDHIE
jgi:hypothetical protein